MEHTPGPWAVVHEGTLISASGGLVAAAEFANCSVGQAKANACLIAAAPELLAACQNALNTCSPAAADVIRTAIAKAKGN